MSRSLLMAVWIALALGALPAAAKDCNAICKSRCPSGGMTGPGGSASCVARCMSFCTSSK